MARTYSHTTFACACATSESLLLLSSLVALFGAIFKLLSGRKSHVSHAAMRGVMRRQHGARDTVCRYEPIEEESYLLYAAARQSPNHDVATTWCRYAAQLSDTRPKLVYETQVPAVYTLSLLTQSGWGWGGAGAAVCMPE